MAELSNRRIVGVALAVVIVGMTLATVWPDQVESPSAAVPEQAVLIESAALAAAFADNEIAAAAQYGVPVRIRGAIEEITTTFGGAPLLALDGGVNVALNKSELARAADLHKGEVIEVMCGKVRAALGTVNGLDCVSLPAGWASSAP